MPDSDIPAHGSRGRSHTEFAFRRVKNSRRGSTLVFSIPRRCHLVAFAYSPDNLPVHSRFRIRFLVDRTGGMCD